MTLGRCCQSLANWKPIYLISLLLLFTQTAFSQTDCCDQGDKVQTFTFQYTGEGCSSSNTSQDDGKWSCDDFSGGPNGDASVYIVSSKDDDGGGDIYFSGTVGINETFSPSATAAGEDKFPSNTYHLIYSSQGGTLLQILKIHASCSAPVIIGDQFGALVLENAVFLNGFSCGPPICEPLDNAGLISGDESNCDPYDPTMIMSDEEPTGPPPSGGGGDCCDSGGDKVQTFTFRYNGDNCGSSNTSQDDGKWDCDDFSGGPNGDASVYIVSSKDDGGGGDIYFSGTVGINETFSPSATVAGEDKFPSNTYHLIYSSQGGTILQVVKVHASCSAPVVIGDQFGALVLENAIFKNGFSCGPQALEVEYAWSSSTSGCPSSPNNLISGATSTAYNPGPITQTTYYVRWARRINCETPGGGTPDWMASNCVIKTVGGGDSDGDGVCDNDDNCDFTFNPNQMDSDGDGIGDACDSPCDNQGGDSDGDGVCNNQDCQPFNPAFPATPGTSCDDGNPNTANDVVQGDGCSCTGTPVNNCSVTIGNCSITITGLNSTDYAKVFNSSWQIVWDCNPWVGGGCNSTETITNLENGLYYVEACGSTNPYTITGCTDPCDNQGGDTDGDGVCNNQDCQPFNPDFPTTPGTYCDDGNPNTINDVVLADGCSCAGTPVSCNLSATFNVSDGCLTDSYLLFADANDPYFPPNNPNYFYSYDIQPANTIDAIATSDPRSVLVLFNAPGLKTVTATITDPSVPNCQITLTVSFNVQDCSDPCANQGGDSDGDGVCNNQDCQPFNPAFPTTPGTYCNDGNPNTTNDVVQADGCSCAGTPVGGSPCDSISISVSSGQITISGLGSAPIAQVQVFNSTWQAVFTCSGNCKDTEVVNVPSGSYFVSVKLRNSSWQLICELEEDVTVGGGCNPNLSIGDKTVNEDAGTATVQVCLSCTSISTVSFDYTTADNTAHVGYDYDIVYGTKSIGPGNLCTNITVPIVDDNTAEPTEYFNVNISNPGNAGITDPQGKVTILDNDMAGDPDCDAVTFDIINNGTGIEVSGLSAPISILQVFDPGWNLIFACSGDCDYTETVNNLGSGTYYVKVSFYDSNWQKICDKSIYIVCGGGSSLVSEGEQDIFFFTLQKDKTNASLNWTTNTEFKNEKFIVERSSNGVDFVAINEKESEHDEWDTHYNYTDLDVSPMYGQNFYRIKKVHKDGTFAYSNIRDLSFDLDASKLILYPNPASSEVFLNVNAFAGQKGSIQVVNGLGQTMMSRDYSELPTDKIVFALDGFPSGLYTVTLRLANSKAISKKLIVNKL